MISNKYDRIVQKYPKNTTITSSLHKKGNVSIPTPRLKSDRLNKPKPESLATPASRLKNKKHQNCFPLPETPRTVKKTPAPLRMKSLSLVDLPSGTKIKPNTTTQRRTVSREHGDVANPSNKDENRINNIFSFTSTKESELAKFVCRKFIVHAWRKRRAQNNSLQLKTERLKKYLDDLKVQNDVLKTLLVREFDKVTKLMGELGQASNQLEKERKVSRDLNETLNKLEASFSHEKELWNSTEVKMEKRIESLKNELDLAVGKSLHLEETVCSYKQQLDGCRKDKVSLTDKYEASETSLKHKMNVLNTLQNKFLDLQMTVEGLVTRNQELVREKEGKEKQIKEYINNLKNVEVELNNFQNIQKVHSSDFVKLRNGYEQMKTQINSKDLEIGCLKEAIKQYEVEKNQTKSTLKTALLRVFQVSLNLIPLPNYIPF